MPSDWIQATLGQLADERGAEIKTGPFGTKLKATEYTDHGAPLISVREIQVGRIVVEDRTPRVPTSVQERLPEYLLRAGDIVFARKGGIDRSAFVPPEQAGFFLGSDALRVRLPADISPRFVAYQAQSRQMRAWLEQNATGSTMPSLSGRILARMPVTLPPLDEQRRIAAILGALDDKIELNRKMNQTLEAMAQAIFKSWFIDFDGIPKSDLVDSELGPIPKGWTIDEIGNAVRVVGGTTPRTKEPTYWDGGIHHWTTPKDLSSANCPLLLDTARRITDAGLAKISSGLLPADTFLLSSRAPVGYTAIAKVPLAVNQGYIAIPPGGRLSPLYLLHWARANLGVIKSRASGTTFQEVTKKSFRPIRVVIPSDAKCDEFDGVVGELFAKIEICERESQTLAHIRDALLPKLISGQIRVPEAQTTVEAAL